MTDLYCILLYYIKLNLISLRRKRALCVHTDSDSDSVTRDSNNEDDITVRSLCDVRAMFRSDQIRSEQNRSKRQFRLAV